MDISLHKWNLLGTSWIFVDESGHNWTKLEKTEHNWFMWTKFDPSGQKMNGHLLTSEDEWTLFDTACKTLQNLIKLDVTWNYLTHLDAIHNLTQLDTTWWNLTQLNLRSYAQILCLFNLCCPMSMHEIDFSAWSHFWPYLVGEKGSKCYL